MFVGSNSVGFALQLDRESFIAIGSMLPPREAVLLDYFMWIDWDVPRRMEAKLAVGPLDIDSIVLLLSSSLFIHHCFGVFCMIRTI